MSLSFALPVSSRTRVNNSALRAIGLSSAGSRWNGMKDNYQWWRVGYHNKLHCQVGSRSIANRVEKSQNVYYDRCVHDGTGVGWTSGPMSWESFSTLWCAYNRLVFGDIRWLSSLDYCFVIVQMLPPDEGSAWRVLDVVQQKARIGFPKWTTGYGQLILWFLARVHR